MGFHKDVTGLDIHVLHFQTFADNTARDAYAYVAADVGKVVFVTATGIYHIVTNEVGPTFASLAQSGGSPLEIEIDGTSESTDATLINFTGAGVTTTEPVADQFTVTVPGLDVEDENVSIEAATTVLNFLGAGVTATNPSANQVDVTIPGGGGGALDIEDEGTSVDAATVLINFIGAGVTATTAGAGLIDVTIPGGGAASFDDIVVDAGGNVVTSGGNVVSI